MDIQGWDERYRNKRRPQEDFAASATKLVVETAERLTPGDALDLACGTGRNALWLAERGWRVKAVDGSAAAIESLQAEAQRRDLPVETEIADLTAGYAIVEATWDLVLIAYYLQRDLFEPARRGVRPGGTTIAIVHITREGEEPTESRLRPGELEGYFAGWEITHRYEGKPNDPAHQRPVAEIVARRPSR